MSCKRPFPHQDPDYDQVAAIQSGNKRLKHIENDAKVVTVRKIDSIVKRQFDKEINAKEGEIEAIDDRLYQSRQLIDNLRAALVINFYSAANQTTTNQPIPGKVAPPPSIHPVLRKFLGKTSKSSHGSCEEQITGENSQEPFGPSGSQSQSPVNFNIQETANLPSQTPAAESQSEDLFFADGSRAARFKVKKRIVVGNISKYIPVDKRDDKDQSTHKWMVYVRGPRHEPGINHFVKKVWFFLHPTYRPNDLVEVSQPPFHLTRRGWGEFPVRVQLHFYDQRNKRVDIIHTLKLDKTFTGLQTLGAETVVDLLLYKPDMCLNVDHIPNCPSPSADRTDDHSRGCEPAVVPPENSPDVKNTFFSSDFDHQYWKKHQGDSNVTLQENSTEICRENQESDCDSIEAKPNSTNNHSVVDNHNKLVAPPHQTLVDKLDDNITAVEESVPKIAAGICRKNEEIARVGSDSVQREAVSGLDCSTAVQSSSVSDSVKSSTTSGKSSVLSVLEDSSSETSEKTSPANGLATFVKCVDKQGNFYLVPYSAFLKLHSLQGGAAMVVSATSVQHAGSTSVPIPSVPIASAPKLVSLVSQGNKTMPSALPSSIVKSSSGYSNITQQSGFPSIMASSSSSSSSATCSSSNSTPSQNFLLSAKIGQKYVMDVVAPLNTNTTASSCEVVKKNAASFQVGRSILKPRQENEGSAACDGTRKRFHIDECVTMAQIVEHFIKKRPLCHPVCMATVEKFLSWNVGKRCASEWQRAKAVQKDISDEMPRSCNWKIVDVWTVKRILLWARHYGYTPLKSSLHNSSAAATDPIDNDVELIKMNTYSSTDLLFKRLHEQGPQIGQSHCSDNSDDEVDVVSVNDTMAKCRSPSPKNNSNLCKLLYTKEADFIRDTALQIDVKLKPMQIVEGVEGPVAEELLFSAMKQFMEDLLRNSLAKAFQRVQNRRNPDSIQLADVVNVLCELPFCDFLTNHHLGKCEGSSVCLNNLSKF